MYNEEQKWSFIHDYTSNEGVANSCRNLFEIIEPLERELDLDICQVKDANKIHDFLDGNVGMRLRSISVRLSTLRAYCRWCQNNGVKDATSTLLDVKITPRDRLAETRVGSPEQLEQFLNALFDNEEELTYDIVLRCYCWLGFMGVQEDRVEHILSKDVDLKNLKVVVDGKDYGIYLVYNDDDVICNAATCFRKCKDMDAFRYFHPLYNEIIWRQRVDGPQLLRGIKSGPRCDRLRETLSRANTKAIKEGRTQLRLTYQRLWLCGLFYQTYLKELQGETIDFRNIAIAILENRNEKNDESRKSWIAHNTVEFKRDYISWKELYDY